MQKQKGIAKLTGGLIIFGLIAVAVLVGPSVLNWIAPGTISQGGAGPWADKLVDFQIITTDKFSGADEAATVKVYDVKPADYGNPRGTFTDTSLYTSYTAASGVVTVNKEKPGTYYCVGTVASSNTEFLAITIPDGTGRDEPLSDYNTEPDADLMDFSAVGSTTDEDFAITLDNETDNDVRDSLTLTVADSTELRGWKVIVDDTEGYSVDADGDGIYDEGIKAFEVCVCGTCDLFFKPANGIDKLDSNNEYTFEIRDCNVEDGNDITVAVDIDANTASYTGADDELWGEGEGILAYIKIYDDEGNLFSTTDVTA